MGGDNDDIADMSTDDMSFEIKRLRQKVQVLQNDKLILQEEYDISKNSKQANELSKLEGERMKHLEEELTKTRNLLNMSGKKFRLTQTFLELERKALSDIKVEVASTTSRLMKEMDAKMNIFKDTVLVRESTLQRRYKKVNAELFKSKEMVERYKVEISQLKDDRRTLQRNLDNVDAELTIEKNKLKSQFDAITSKIDLYKDEHAREVQKLRDDIEKKNKENQFHEDELAKWKVTLKLRVEEKVLVDKKVEELEAELLRNKTLAHEELTKVRESTQDLESTCTQLREENVMLIGRWETLQSQQSKLLHTHDSLQNDFKSLLARENSLRSEISGNSNDKNDMQRKLRSINEKVSSMEAEHSQEINELRETIEQKQQLLDSALDGREREGVRAENLGREVKRLEMLIQTTDVKVRELGVDLQQVTSQKENVEKQLEIFQKETSSISSSVENLRNDRDDAINQSLQYQEQVKKINVLLSERELSLRELSKKQATAAASDSELTRLKNELQQAEDKNDQQVVDIRGLKDTVRRECEERTELMIEMSELRDQIKRLHNMNKGGPLRSQSSGVQAHQEFKKPETSELGMLRQIAASSNSEVGGVVSTAHENDASWSKQRQAAQQNTGKARRKSKYR